jgi:hypothetical protein
MQPVNFVIYKSKPTKYRLKMAFTQILNTEQVLDYRKPISRGRHREEIISWPTHVCCYEDVDG